MLFPLLSFDASTGDFEAAAGDRARDPGVGFRAAGGLRWKWSSQTQHNESYAKKKGDDSP